MDTRHQQPATPTLTQQAAAGLKQKKSCPILRLDSSSEISAKPENSAAD